MTQTEIKQKCRYYAEHCDRHDEVEREIRRAFVGMYNCLNDLSPITVVFGEQVITKCENVIKLFKEIDTEDAIKKADFLKEAVDTYKKILQNLVNLSK